MPVTALQTTCIYVHFIIFICISPGSRSRHHGYLDEVALGLLMHFIFYIVLVLLANPESYRSTGPHQEIGDCDHVTYVNTILGQVGLVNKSRISWRLVKSKFQQHTSSGTVCVLLNQA